MKFLVDSMLPPRVAELLDRAGHDATTPARHGAHNLPDDVLVVLAGADGRVIVTANARDFAAVGNCPALFVRKAWWSSETMAEMLAAAVDRWAIDNAEPGPWAHWLTTEPR